jgi:dolichol-phosphate mannosyltransferase
VRLAFKRYGAAFVEHSGFQCMADILVRLARLGAIVDEVPLVLRYDRKRGESKMRVARTVLQTLRLLVVRRFRP